MIARSPGADIVARVTGAYDWLALRSSIGRRGPPGIQQPSFANDQFGLDIYTCYGPRELCVPSGIRVP